MLKQLRTRPNSFTLPL